MYKAKLCLGLNNSYEMPEEEQIRVLRRIGFDGFFSGWSRKSDIAALRKVADEEGMIYQSIHAPFTKVDSLWYEDERTADAVEELIECVRACADNGVPVMVCHAFIGFEKHEPTPEGIANFEKIVREAERLQVRIALENTEGEEYLEALMAHFAGNPWVGFCWDTGHEMCYNHEQDMLARYGDRLFATHLNDNLGIRDFAGKITFHDDLHLLPFDGIGDWADMAKRLCRCGFDGPLTFELKRTNQPGRHESDAYMQLSPFEYLTQVYMRACRFGALKVRAQGK